MFCIDVTLILKIIAIAVLVILGIVSYGALVLYSISKDLDDHDSL